MFETLKIKAEIKRSKRIIEELESKRSRSQAALVEAILTNKTPDDDDVEWFNRYTTLIEEERNKMHELTKKLG
jgi:hypothetical protein